MRVKASGVRVLMVVAAAALVLAGIARAEKPTVRFNAPDQAAAKAIVVKAADLGTGWRGGLQKPDISDPAVECPGWNPKQADLVVTGAAESRLTTQGAAVMSSAYVLATPRMVQLDWQRTVAAPAAQRCMRQTLAKEPGLKLVSFQRLGFPRIAPYALRFRAVYEYGAGEQTVRVLMDFVLLGKGRSELLLSVVAPYADRAAADQLESRLARLMLSRVRA